MSQALSRRAILGRTAGAVATGAIAAGASQRAAAAPNVVRQTGSNVEVTFWYGLGSDLGERIQELIADFNAQNTGVVVTGVQNASYEDTAQSLALALQDGSFPDVVLLPEQLWFRFYLANAFVPLDDLITSSGFEIDDVVPALRNEGFRNGSYHWLPVARSTALMYYNKTLYDAAGIPGPAETWSQLREFGPALTDASQQVYGMAFDASAWYFQGVVWAFGGEFSTPEFEITFNREGAVNAGEYYRTAVQDGWGFVPQDTASDFTNGFLATALSSTGGLKARTDAATANGFEIRTAFMPSEVEPVTRSACVGGSGLSIMANIPAERQAAAFAFYAYWASTERTTWWSQNTGYMPVRVSAVEGPEMQAFFAANPNFKVAVDQLAQRAAPSDPARRFLASGQNVIDLALQQVTVNNMPTQQAFDEAAATLTIDAQPVIDQIIAKEGDLTRGAATPAATPLAAG